MGTIRNYTDVLGRPQIAVDGPQGTYLITRTRDTDPYEVWRSDSLRALTTTRDAPAALEAACTNAGLTI